MRRAEDTAQPTCLSQGPGLGSHTQSHGPLLGASKTHRGWGREMRPWVQPSPYLCGTDCGIYRASPAREMGQPGSPAETASLSAPLLGIFRTDGPDPATHHQPVMWPRVRSAEQ